MSWSCAFALDPHIRFFLGSMFSFQGSVPSDFGFCFVAVSRRLVYNTMWPALCQHLFCYFFKIFCETLGFVEKEACLIIAFIGIKISSKNLKISKIFLCSADFFLNYCLFFFPASLSARCRFITYSSGACFYILSFKINTLSFQ